MAAMIGAFFLLALGSPQSLTGELLTSRLTDDVWQIWVRDLATGEDTQLTSTPGDKRYPGWTPDGEVYYHTINQGCFVIRASGGHEPVLAELWPVRDLEWAPDGSAIAFSRIRTDLIDAANLCLAGRAGATRWLTQDPGIQYTPSWSPDGTRLAFVSGNGWGTYEIETVRADGTERRKLTKNAHHEFLPAWSPDGRALAFVSDRDGSYDVWAMTAEGAGPRRLTDHPGLDTAPCWSPDGRSIAYATTRGGVLQIWSVPTEGGVAAPLLEAPGGARDPAWRAKEPAKDLAPAEPFLLSEIGVAPKILRPAADARVELRFRLSHSGDVRLDLVDEEGRVRRSFPAAGLDAGVHTIVWDGADFAGKLVPDGVYRYVLTAEDEYGRTAVHDPSTHPWGEEMQPTEFTFDEANGRLRWVQPRAGFARLRVAVHNFPLLGTLLDWEPLEGGEQIFDWNGLDASGTVQLGSHPSRWITLELISMPANTVIVKGAGTPAAAEALAPPTYPPLVATGPPAHLEARKPRANALAPGVALEFPTASATDTEGRPVLEGMVPVRVSLDPAHAPSMTDALFEVAFYVDLTFYFEDEESTTPMTWLWDTSTLSPGPHLLTVNVFSYDGRIGCLTRSVVIKSAQ